MESVRLDRTFNIIKSKHLILHCQVHYKKVSLNLLNSPGMASPPLPWVACSTAWQPFPWRNQTKPPLLQFDIISSHLVTCHLGEKDNCHLTTASFQIVVKSERSPLSFHFSRLNNPFPKLLLITLGLHTLQQLCYPSLDSFQHLNVFLVGRDPKLN